MSFGLGLGSFVDGFQKGYSFVEDQKEAERRRKQDEEDRAYLKDERAYNQAERARVDADREAVETISEEGQAGFEKAVASGEYTADQVGEFWEKNVAPRLAQTLFDQGDYAGATALLDWRETRSARKGVKLFGDAMVLQRSGNLDAAIDKAMEAATLSGYGGLGLEYKGKERIEGDGTTPPGWRISFTDEDGNEIVQTVADADVPTLIAGIANPQAAWERQQEVAAAELTRQQELDDYKTKKKIDAETSGKGTDLRQKAYETLLKQDEGNSMTEGYEPFGAAPPQEQQRRIDEYLTTIGAGGGGGADAMPEPLELTDEELGAIVPYAPPGSVPASPTAPAAPGAPAAPAQAPTDVARPTGLGGVPTGDRPGRTGASNVVNQEQVQRLTPAQREFREKVQPVVPLEQPPPQDAWGGVVRQPGLGLRQGW